jgi:DNA-binding winged helix-turn-helix (wHTH) protein
MQGPGGQRLAVGRFELDRIRNRLVHAGGEIEISPLACRLLEVLAQSPGEIVRRETLVDRLWDGNVLVGEPALNRVVSELRKAAGDDPKSPELVQTIPRRGYRLVAAPATVGAPAAARTNRMPRWAVVLAIAVLVAGAAALVAEWMISQMIGLEWTRTHGD